MLFQGVTFEHAKSFQRSDVLEKINSDLKILFAFPLRNLVHTDCLSSITLLDVVLRVQTKLLIYGLVLSSDISCWQKIQRKLSTATIMPINQHRLSDTPTLFPRLRPYLFALSLWSNKHQYSVLRWNVQCLYAVHAMLRIRNHFNWSQDDKPRPLTSFTLSIIFPRWY